MRYKDSIYEKYFLNIELLGKLNTSTYHIGINQSHQCLYVRLFIGLYVCLSIGLPVNSPVDPSVGLTVGVFAGPSVRRFICLSVPPLIRLPVRLSICLSVRQCVRPSVCLSVDPSVRPSPRAPSQALVFEGRERWDLLRARRREGEHYSASVKKRAADAR